MFSHVRTSALMGDAATLRVLLDDELGEVLFFVSEKHASAVCAMPGTELACVTVCC